MKKASIIISIMLTVTQLLSAQTIESKLNATRWTLRNIVRHVDTAIAELSVTPPPSNTTGVSYTDMATDMGVRIDTTMPTSISIKQNKTFRYAIETNTTVAIVDDLGYNASTGVNRENITTVMWQNDDDVSLLSFTHNGNPVTVSGLIDPSKCNVITIYRSHINGLAIDQVCYATVVATMAKRGTVAVVVPPVIPPTGTPSEMTITDNKNGVYTNNIFSLASGSTAGARGITINPINGNYIQMSYNSYKNTQVLIAIANEPDSYQSFTGYTKEYGFYLNANILNYYENATPKTIASTFSNGDIYRMRFDNTSGTMSIVYEKSANAGVSFTPIVTVPYTNTAAIYVHLNITTADRQVDQPKFLNN